MITKTILTIAFIAAASNNAEERVSYIHKDMGTEAKCEAKKRQVEKFYQKAQKYRTGYRQIIVSCEAPVKSQRA